MRHTLEHHKLKKTGSRELILDILEKAKGPISVEEVFDLLKKTALKQKDKLKTPDLVTIYRTLETFKLSGIVREVVFKDRTTRYEVVDVDGNHCHHAVCNICGVTEHIDDPAIEKALQTLTKKLKKVTVINDHVLEFFGVCKTCAKG
jgi:Fe2+ or Zn2+ uptake regulation protein